MIININDVSHYVEVHGQGESLIFLHGLYMDHHIWEFQVRQFAKSHQVIVYDQRGHGASETGTAKITFDQLADDLFTLIQTLKITKPVLIGYSTAGAIVLNALTRYPGLAKAAVVTGAFGAMRGTYIYLNQKVGLFSTRFHLKKLTALLLALNHATSYRQFRRFAKSVLKSDQTAIEAILKDMGTIDVIQQLKQTTCPVLLLYGSREHLHYRAELLKLVHAIPSVQLHFIQGIRHATMTKTADQFYVTVSNFLSTVTNST